MPPFTTHSNAPSCARRAPLLEAARAAAATVALAGYDRYDDHDDAEGERCAGAGAGAGSCDSYARDQARHSQQAPGEHDEQQQLEGGSDVADGVLSVGARAQVTPPHLAYEYRYIYIYIYI